MVILPSQIAAEWPKSREMEMVISVNLIQSKASVKLNCVLTPSRHSLVYNKYFTDALNNSECRTTCPADLHSSMRSDVTSCPMTRQYVRRTGAYTCVTVPSSTHGSQTTSVLAVCSIERSKNSDRTQARGRNKVVDLYFNRKQKIYNSAYFIYLHFSFQRLYDTCSCRLELSEH